MEDVVYVVAIMGFEAGLAALITWFVIQLRGEASEAESRRRLAELEREEEELKKAA